MLSVTVVFGESTKVTTLFDGAGTIALAVSSVASLLFFTVDCILGFEIVGIEGLTNGTSKLWEVELDAAEIDCLTIC